MQTRTPWATLGEIARVFLKVFGLGEVVALLIGGVVGALWLRLGRPQEPDRAAQLLVAGLNLGAASTGGTAIATATVTITATVTPPLWHLGLVFLKIGAVLFGSGYVLIAFVEGEVVGRG